jgi:hypothetical protein
MARIPVVLYTRVSTDFADNDPRRQDTANQELELRRFAESQGWEIVCVYSDRGSGSKGRDKRPQFDAMLNDAAKRRFDVLLVWSVDRLSRQGPYETLDVVKRLSGCGGRFRSLQQLFLDTTNGFGEVLLALFGWPASEGQVDLGGHQGGTEAGGFEGQGLGRKPVDIDLGWVRSLHGVFPLWEFARVGGNDDCAIEV